MGELELSPQQATAVEGLSAALEGFGAALVACLQVGLSPADSLRAAGIEIPVWAGPVVNRLELGVLEQIAQSGDLQPAP